MKKKPRKKICKHETVAITWRLDGEELSRRCSTTFGCGAQLGLGPSNDQPTDVKVEMRAAHWFASVIDEWLTVGPAQHLPRGAARGWSAHATDRSPAGDDEGWLLREMYIVRADLREVPLQQEDWAWDPDRPLAGQFEEWVKRGDALIAAMEDDAAAGLDTSSAAPDLAIGAMGKCEACGEPIGEDEEVQVWGDGIITHLACSDDSDEPDDQALEDDDAISDADTARAIEAQERTVPTLSAFEPADAASTEPWGDDAGSADATRRIDAAAYEAQRAAEPDLRDEDAP